MGHTSHTHSSLLRDFSCFKVDGQLSVLPLGGGAGGVACRRHVLARRCAHGGCCRGNSVPWGWTGRGGTAVGGMLLDDFILLSLWLAGGRVLSSLWLVSGCSLGGIIKLLSFLVLLVGRDSLFCHLSESKVGSLSCYATSNIINNIKHRRSNTKSTCNGMNWLCEPMGGPACGWWRAPGKVPAPP